MSLPPLHWSLSADLCDMAQFPATHALLTMIVKPAAIAAISPRQFETALKFPTDHVPLLANLHARLLGISPGAAAEKKWLDATARFVRRRPHEFAPLAHAVSSPDDASESRAGHREPDRRCSHGDHNDSHANNDDENNDRDSDGDDAPIFVFPVELDDYVNKLTPAIRLLVLHVMAENALAEHEQVLPNRLVSTIPIDELRRQPLGMDAVGNIYWYFNDDERIYREPRDPEQVLRKLAEATATARQSDRKRNAVPAAAAEPESVNSAKRKRANDPAPARAAATENNSRLVADIFGGDDSSQDSVELLTNIASSASKRARIVTHLRQADASPRLPNGSANPTPAGLSRALNTPARPVRKARARSGDAGPSNSAKAAATQPEQATPPVARRQSSRRRKPPERHGAEYKPAPSRGAKRAQLSATRPAKRPRRMQLTFVDVALRKCDAWQTLTIGSDALTALLERFAAEEGGVLPAERPLVYALKEVVLLRMVETESKARIELERKQRMEQLVTTQKRSSRLEAISIRRAEEARVVAEQEQRERDKEEQIALYERSVKALLAAAGKEQSRDIRNARRLHGNDDAIARDEKLQYLDNKVKEEATVIASVVPVRRSERRSRASRLHGTAASSTGESGTGLNQSNGVSCQEAETSGGDVDGEAASAASPAVEAVVKTEVKEEAEEVGIATGENCEEESNGLYSLLSNGCREEEVDDNFTWKKNAADGLPCRVLDKFFFASRETFSEVGLEHCSEKTNDVMGVGILISPTWSTASVKRVEMTEVTDWVFEHGRDPKQWVKSGHAWYELRTTALEYEEIFASGRRKFELCARLGILGRRMRAAHLDFDSVMELLKQTYNEMQGYDERDVMDEKRFIFTELKKIDRKALNESGFMRKLSSKIKAEDKKAVAAKEKAAARAMAAAAAAAAAAAVADDSSENGGEFEGGTVANGKTSGAKTRSAKGRRQASKVASSIVSSLVRSAMKGGTKSQSGKQAKKRRIEDKTVANGMVAPEKRRKVGMDDSTTNSEDGEGNDKGEGDSVIEVKGKTKVEVEVEMEENDGSDKC